jgi:RNA polymerase sigma-54 factor
MAITTKLELRQSHNLVMTPQLQQAIKLLQLSNMELASFVEAELERNPLLEHADAEETGGATPEPAAEPQTASAKEEADGGVERPASEPSQRGRRRRMVDLEGSEPPGTGCRAARRIPRCRKLLPGALKDSAGPRSAKARARA